MFRINKKLDQTSQRSVYSSHCIDCKKHITAQCEASLLSMWNKGKAQARPVIRIIIPNLSTRTMYSADKGFISWS